MRITEAILANNFLRDLGYNNTKMSRTQQQLASGTIISLPSQDPGIAGQVMDINDHLRRASEYMRNASVGTSFLSETDNILSNINSLIISARTLAVHASNGTINAAQRRGTAAEVQQILDEIVDSGNRRFRGRFIFAGFNMLETPFEITGDGVIYNGDAGRIGMRMSDNSKNFINITGREAFGAFDATVQGGVDLDPALDLAPDGTMLRDLNGGVGFTPGYLDVTYGAVPTTVRIDLSGAETLEDVATLIQAGTGGAVTVGVDGTGHALTLAGPGTVTVADVNGNTTARSLGILGSGAGGFTGMDIDPRITALTRVSSLLNGAFDTSGFTITNGSASVTITAADLGGTVQDLLGAINNSAANVHAEISADGRSLDISSRVNGATMTITENGGTTAADLGIASAGVRADNIFTTLIDLRDALMADDGPGIEATIAKFDTALDKILQSRSEAGARVQRFDYSSARHDDEHYNMTALLSEVNDVDYSKAVMDYQQLSNQMEAALRVAANVLPLSLADFL